ncbi:MAG: transposase [Candidatus Dojkabacteria bacterium]|jgi:putative transposase
MPRPKRNFQSNSFYHIYNRGNNRDTVLKLASDKQIFVNLLYRNKDKCQIRLVNYCIMDNHFHLIVKTGKDPKNLSKFMQRVLTSFAIQINKKHQRIGHTFQGRYNANLLLYKKDLVRAINYVRQNPVQEGLVRKPSEYPWTKE